MLTPNIANNCFELTSGFYIRLQTRVLNLSGLGHQSFMVSKYYINHEQEGEKGLS